MKARVAVVALFVAGLVGCKDSTRAQFESLGSRHHIVMYSGGQKVGEWYATGNVSNESQSDGWYFRDEKTGKLVEVTGQIVITQE
jgi:hypothetical protein